MPLFTCISCRVVFANSELQKAHYKTDWHRYNLKRKVADLPPVNAVDFQQRVLERKAQISQENKCQGTYCKLCCKHFGNSKAYANHVLSKKHQEKEVKENEILVQKRNEKNTEKGIDVSDDEENVKELTSNASNLDIKDNSASSSSGFDMKYCVPSTKTNLKKPADVVAQPSTSTADQDSDCDSDGSWESVEGEALPIEACLFCPILSESLEKNMQHMTREHRFFIPDAEYLNDLEGLISYLGEKVGDGNMCLWCSDHGKTFYSSRAAQQHMMDKNHCMMLHEGDTLVEYSDFYDYRPSYPDYKERKAAGTDDDDDDEVKIEALETDGYELVLPSGATIGHRSLQLYYKQNLPQRKYSQTGKLLPRLLAQYKSLGWTGTSGPVAQKKARDVAYVQHLRAKRNLQISVKANKLMKHFRPQVVF